MSSDEHNARDHMHEILCERWCGLCETWRQQATIARCERERQVYISVELVGHIGDLTLNFKHDMHGDMSQIDLGWRTWDGGKKAQNMAKQGRMKLARTTRTSTSPPHPT